MNDFSENIPLSWNAKQYLYVRKGKLNCKKCECELVTEGETMVCPVCGLRIRLRWQK